MDMDKQNIQIYITKMILGQDKLNIQINSFLGQNIKNDKRQVYWHLLTCDPGTGEQL